MRFVPYAAAAAAAAAFAVAYLAFPNVETRTVTVKTDPFAGFTQQGFSEERISEDYLARCDYYGNRPGIVEGTVPPRQTDVVLIRCAAVKAGAPVG